MASSGKQLNVRMNFQVDTTQAQQQLKSLYSQLNQITSASAFGKNSQLGITQEIMQATKAAAQLKTAITEAVNPLTGNLDLTKFNDQLRMSQMSLTDYRNQLSALGTTGNQAFNQLARSIMTAETPLLRTSKAAQTMWTVLGNTVRWQATSSLLHGIMSTASQAMGYVKSLDSSLNNIRIVTGQSQEQMAQFAKTANQAAKELNTSTNEYAKASLIYYQQGLSNKQVEERTRTTIKLANVAGQSAKTVSDQMTAVWNNFYNGSKSIEYYADVITALGATTASSSEEIAKGLQKFSSIAETTGLSYEYATSALATVVATTRQSADSVGTSFKTLFSRLQSLNLGETLDDGTTLNKYSKALDAVGVSIKKANGDLKDMDDILADLGVKWQSLSKDQQVALAQTVGGVRNYTGLVALMDNWDTFQENLKTAQTAQGTLQNQADIYAESWQAASAHVKAASETIYKNLLDDKFFKGLTNSFGTVLDIIGSLTNSLGGFKGTMLTIGTMATQLFGSQLAGVFGNIGLNLRSLTPSGRQSVLDLKTEARNAIASPTNFSQFEQINNLQRNYGKAFNKRQVLYEDLIRQGKIADYEKPAYQMLFNAANMQNEQAIIAAEQSYITQEAADLATIRGRQLFNYQLTHNGRQQQELDQFYVNAGLSTEAARKSFGKYMRNYEIANNPNITGQAKLSAQGNLARWTQPGQAWSNFTPEMIANFRSAQNYNETYRGQFSNRINDYNKQIFGESIAASVNSQLRLATMNGTISPEDVLRTANYITRTVEGAKAYGLELGNQYPWLTETSKQIAKQTELYEKGTLSREEYNKSITNILSDTNFQSSILDILSSTATGSSVAIRQQLIEDVMAQNAGMSNKDASDQVDAILNAQDKSNAEKIEAIQKLGGSGAVTKVIQKNLEEQAKLTQGINFSSALVTNMGALAALGQSYSAISGVVKTFKNEQASVNDTISAFTSLAMTGTMVAKPFKNFFESAQLPVKAFGKELGITNGQLGLIGLGLTAATIATKVFIQEQHKASIQGSIESLNASIATSQQLASDAKEKYDNLFTLTDTHNNLLDNLKELKVGTSEFTNALLIANDTAQELISNYDLLYGEDYTYGRYGEINFKQSSLERAKEEALENKEERQIGLQQLRLAQKTLQTFESGISELTSIGPQFKLAYKEEGAEYWGRTHADKNIGTLIQQLAHRDFAGTSAESVEDYITQLLTGQSEYSVEDIDFSNLETQKQILGMTNSNTIEQAISKISTAVSMYRDSENQDNEKDALLFIANLFDSEAYNQMQANGEESIALALQSMNYTGKNSDLIQLSATSGKDFTTNMLALYQIATQAGVKNFAEDILGFTLKGTSPKGWYRDLFGEFADSNLSDEQVESLVQQKLINDILINGTQKYSDKLKLPGTIIGLEQITKELQDYNLPNIENLRYNQIQKEFDKIKDQTLISYNASIFTNNGKNIAIQKYADYTKQLFENQIDDLQEAVLLSFSDTAIEAASQGIKDKNSEKISKAVTNLIGEIISDGIKIEDSGLTYGSLKTAVNAMTKANTIGTEAGQTMYQMLLESRTITGGFNGDLMSILRNYNFDNTISGLYTNNQLKKYAQNNRQRDMYQNLLASQIKDMQEEKGFFMALYNSSGFADVMDALNQQFQQTGQITAQNIINMSQKSDELAKALKIGVNEIEGLNVNAGGLADLFTEINKGTLGVQNISSTLISAMSTAANTESERAEAFEIVDNLDLGRSGTELLKYFQEAGKAYFTAYNADWGFYTEPIQNLIKTFGGQGLLDEYNRLAKSGTGTAKELFDQMPDYFTDFMYTMAGVSGKGKNKKAKGGGGPEDVWGYVYDMLNEAGFDVNSSEFWEQYGFKVSEDGSVQLDLNQEDLKQEDLEHNLSLILTGLLGWDEEAAKQFSSVSWTMAADSARTGFELDRREAIAGYKELLNSEVPQGEAGLRAYFNRNRQFLTDKNGNPYAEGDQGFQTFLKEYEESGGNVGFSTKDQSEWDAIKTKEDLLNAVLDSGIQTTYQKIEETGRTYKVIDTSGYHLDANGLPVDKDGNPVFISPENRRVEQINYGVTDENAAVDTFKGLAAAYGAYDQIAQTWDYDKLVTMIESMNGTEQDLIEILEASPEYFADAIYGKDKYGNIIQRNLDESIQHFVDRLNMATGTQLMTSGLNEEAATIAQGAAAIYWRDPRTGEVVLDPDGESRRQYQKWQTKNADAGFKKKGTVGKFAEEEKGFEDLTTDEMESSLDVTAQALRERVLSGGKLTGAQQTWLQMYNERDLTGTDRAATNRILTQLLYNTDEIVDSTGIIADETQQDDEAKNIQKKKAAEEAGLEYNPETGEWELPEGKEPAAPSGSGWDGTVKVKTDDDKAADAQKAINALKESGQSGSASYVNADGITVTVTTDDQVGQSASGQNNHVLTFASGKEGHIAVTGELGPELRIKEDGSADLLGKKGREYTWVEPGDRIYTAVQTAGILGNNNIPQLEGLAKGIQNYIPGYAADWGAPTDWGNSSSGGNYSGGGGEDEKDPRYDPNTLKIRDILERYYTILQQLNVIANAVEHISKVVDRGWGQERIKAIQEQTALYRKQYEAQVKYVQEIRSYTKTDKEALTTMVREFVEGYNEGKDETDRITWNGAQFDENGVLTNYKDFVEKLVEQYNENAEENAGDKEAQYKFQEQLKDIQFYTESLNLLMTEEEKLYDLQNQILDNSVREITYRVEYENELDNNQLRLINYQFGKVKDDAYEAASAIDLLAQKSDYAQKSLNRYEEGFFDILGVYSNPELVKNMRQDFFDNSEKFFEEWSKYENNLNFQDITTEHAQLIEQYMDGMVSNLQELRSNFQQTVSMMGDNIKEFGKILDSEISKFDYYADVQKSLKNIIGLTNRNMTNIDSAFLAGLNSMQYDNAINRVTANRRRVATVSTQQRDAQAMYDEMMARVRAATSEQERLEWQQAADNAKKVLDTANEQFQNANKELLSSVEDTMQKIQDIYKEAIEEVSRNFEASLSPYYKSLDLIQSSFDRQQKLSELYVKDYQRIHDLSKLNRDIEQSVLDTDNLKSKSRLRELQKQINKLQEDGTELSEYDLDLLDKKYRLELARQALEDAKDAKSVVRLSRDNNGNWGYAYSANTEDIEKRKQDYEDILRETEEANENAMTNYENQLMSIIQEYQQAVSSLDALNLSEEDRTNAMNEIRTFYQDQLDFIKSQMNEVTKNNLYLDPYILDRYGVNEHNLTTDFSKTILAKVLGIDSLDLMASTIQDSFDTLFNGALTAMADATSQQREALENAGLNPDDLAGSVGAIYKIIAEQSSEQVKVVEESADRIDEAFSKTTKEIEKQIDGMDELIKRYEHFETVLEKITEFLELSGEFVPAEKLDFFDLIDSEEELKKVEDSLAKYKSIHVNEVNAEGKQIGYDLTEGSQATIDQIAKWRDAIYRKNAIDVGEAVDTRDELNKINEYLDAHGQAYVNINGELVHLVSGTEETNRLLAEWLAYIEQLEKPEPVNNNSSSGIGQWYNSDGTPIVWGGAWYTAGVSAGAYKESLRKFYSGGYTGRWQSALSGMYTGEWPMGSVESNGRWALLHQKELVLNAHDTENFLSAMEIVRQLDNLTNWMANGLGNLIMPNVTTERESLDQNVHIEANFPNVQNHNEIEQAFENIVNLASQYANRK